jgi:uncharacterized protein (TIGR03066 family)
MLLAQKPAGRIIMKKSKKKSTPTGVVAGQPPYRQAGAKPPTQKPTGRARTSLWTFAALAALCLLVAGGTWAVLEFVVWNTIPSELVGKWEVSGGPQDGATFDFYRGGKLVGRLNEGGMLRVLDATVRVEDDKIYSTTRHPKTGQELTTVQTIRSLTARELVVEDEKGNRMNMRRIE